MKFCTPTPKICQYYHLPLHHAATAVNMAAPVPEIMDMPNLQSDGISMLQKNPEGKYVKHIYVVFMYISFSKY
jgi:hypothetical protein